MGAWYEDNIQRFEQELKDLKSLNVQFKIDEEAKSKKLLRIQLFIKGHNHHFNLIDKSKDLKLTAVYPDEYPYFRPSVYSFDIDLPRHQNPLNKDLCLLGRPTDLWDPQLTLARFLQAQLKTLFEKGTITDENVLKNDATEQAEPQSEYFQTSATILFDPTEISSKTIQAPVEFIGRVTVGIPNDGTEGTRFALLKIKDVQSKIISQLPHSIMELYPDRIEGVLYKLGELKNIEDPLEMLEWLRMELKKIGQKIYFHGLEKKIKDGKIIKNLIGLNFPEEITPGIKQMSGWLFLVIGDIYKPAHHNATPSVRHQFAYYAKATRFSTVDLNLRIPKLRVLSDKIIAVIGLGSLGAPSVIEFAKIGVKELLIIDYDFVDPATIVRWPLGVSVAGVLKTVAIASFIRTNYPGVEVKILNTRFGIGRANATENIKDILPLESRDLGGFLENASLIYDASAEEGVTHYLSRFAQVRSIPFISITATQGAVGGIITSVAPNKTEGCWMCYMWHRYENAIEAPPFESDSIIQARGCGDISFTGAFFDLQNISLAGVRMAVSILSLMDKNGKYINPNWKNYKLLKHKKCLYCGQAQ